MVLAVKPKAEKDFTLRLKKEIQGKFIISRKTAAPNFRKRNFLFMTEKTRSLLQFREADIEDKEPLTEIFEKSGHMGSDASFATMFLWGKRYGIEMTVKDGFVLKLFGEENHKKYGYPCGSGDVKPVLESIIEDSMERFGRFSGFYMLTDENAEELERLYPGKYSFKEMEGSADYIYLRENLALLPGKKYHAKRNHISKFKRLYPDYHFEKLGEKTFDDALTVAAKWCAINGCAGSGGESLGAEYCAINRAFKNFDRLGMFGGVLYVNGEPAAMTAASKINDRVCDVNFEKALDFEGAYAMINNCFASAFTQFEFLNREEDMGLEGLRKAKLSYYPERILTRYAAIPKE